MKKALFCFSSLLLCFVLLICPFSVTADESVLGVPAFELNGKSVLLYNLNADQVIYEKNADLELDMTGLSQIMTALVTMERVENLDKEIVTAPARLYNKLYGHDYPTADVRQGEQLSVRELLYCMMVQNSYEAAEILGDYISEGSESYFAEMMNRKAQELGMTHTNFTNASGREDCGQYSTASDLLLLTKAAMENPTIAEMAATVQHVVPANNIHSESRVLVTYNRLINTANTTYYFDGANGLKVVGTTSTGRCGLFTASRNGLTYYCIVLGAPVYDESNNYIQLNGALTDARDLFSWVYKNYSYKNLVNVDSPCAQVNVRYSSDTDFVLLYPKETFSLLVPDEVDETSVYLRAVLPDSVAAPIKKGQEIGYGELVLNNKVIGSVPLVAEKDISRNQLLFLSNIAATIFLSDWSFLVYGIILFLIIGYFVLMILQNRNRKKHPYLDRRNADQKKKNYFFFRKKRPFASKKKKH